MKNLSTSHSSGCGIKSRSTQYVKWLVPYSGFLFVLFILFAWVRIRSLTPLSQRPYTLLLVLILVWKGLKI